MISLLYILAFVVCLAATAGALLISHSFVATYNTPFHRHYFYYLAAFYLFSIYGFWGQILGRVLLASLDVSAGLAETIASFVSILGIPMLFLSWLMLINIAHSLFGSAASQVWLAVHAVVFVLIIAGALVAFPATVDASAGAGTNLTHTIVGALVALEAIYFAAFLWLALRGGRDARSAQHSVGIRFCLLLAGAFVLRSALLPVAFLGPGGPLVVVAYFGSNLIPLFYLRATNDRLFAPVAAEASAATDLERLLEPFGITKRERQIVEQICSGKTNQQIADALFISLQTVKDHTHRIYGKIGIRSRIQLVNKVNEGA